MLREPKPGELSLDRLATSRDRRRNGLWERYPHEKQRRIESEDVCSSGRRRNRIKSSNSKLQTSAKFQTPNSKLAGKCIFQAPGFSSSCCQYCDKEISTSKASSPRPSPPEEKREFPRRPCM